ncbi:restriction endonuclease subunit S [Acaryochloris marina]|uniref:Type I restriction-modification system S subunit n=1 Tax=Acaryochloris marina (strain MBIC 11017) TaxID=329726 RepID=B0C0Y7_ACAM1|nr:restriction endonuclease subunit S [Acaryochloris marina]ABW27246.1 type I restriction-modification system S subunit [Acaryochloris marina MBIC11017]BDM81994.1 hypothetical protein AM10699_48580 [Acaryochloris marina MBIC10699]
MDLPTFWDNFEVIAEAPGGVQRLRELILDLAVRGKLVPQDPTEGQAQEQLANLRNERAEHLAKTADSNTEYRRMLKKLSALESSVPPFDIPSNWSIAHLIDLSLLVVDCHNKTAPTTFEGIPLIRTTNIRNRQFRFHGMKYVDQDTYEFWSRRCFPEPGDIIFTREAPMGEATIIPDGMKVCLGQRTMLIRVFEQFVDRNFVLLALTEPGLIKRLASNAVGMTVKHLRVKDVEQICLPLPPLAEQKRIVAKVDELMAMCDRYEVSKCDRNTLRTKMRASANDALMNAETDESLNTAWEFVQEHWECLIQEPEEVETVRKVILQLGARGKLSKQTVTDGSVDKVIEQAQHEKNALSKKKPFPKLRKIKPLDEVEQPFQIPRSWTWVRVETICTHIVDCLHRTPKYQENGYPAIRTSDIQPGKILVDQARKVGIEEYQTQTQRLIPQEGDIFYSREGNFGIAAVVPPQCEICLSQRMMQFRVASNIDPYFFSWVMNAPVIFNQALNDAAGMTVPHVNIRSLKQFVFPLPPFAEQKRIVIKVDQLMTFCDNLEAHLHETQEKATALAAAVVGQLEV